ncbi:MAG: hydroxyacid dehydrogenase, partial [Candidatus Marinimicrobia bacterium]|nr:hydroxyacid dehydrogenase [Candidatus Neomarinimicrobiota bacterium]
MKIAIGPSSFASVDKTPLEVLQSKGLEVINNPFSRKLTENEIIAHLKGVDGLIAGLEPLNSNVFQKCPDLKAIARVGIGMENVDMEAAETHKIKVSNTPDGPTDAVAEMTLAAALSLARNIVQANDALHKKKWAKSIGLGLKNTNVLIVGYGRIGRKVADLFRIMGAQILVCDPFVTKNDL